MANRLVAASLFACLLIASPVFAQNNRKQSIGNIKIISGVAAAGVGTAIAIQAGLGDAYDKELLWPGILLAGGGGFLVWWGLDDRAKAKARPSLGFVITPKRATVGYFKRW